jgi:hypothetical protein
MSSWIPTTKIFMMNYQLKQLHSLKCANTCYIFFKTSSASCVAHDSLFHRFLFFHSCPPPSLICLSHSPAYMITLVQVKRSPGNSLAATQTAHPWGFWFFSTTYITNHLVQDIHCGFHAFLAAPWPACHFSRNSLPYRHLKFNVNKCAKHQGKVLFSVCY